LARGQRIIKVGVYARVSTQEQKTLPMQVRALRAYARQRGWAIVQQIKDIGSGASDRPQREQLMQAARRRELNAILVWRLDRWGRSLADLVVTLKELTDLGVGFISLTEALDFTTPTGRALAGLLAVFAEFEREILRERVKAGIAQARQDGRPHGRPPTARRQTRRIKRLYARGLSKAEIARRLHIGRTSVRRILA
jgi:putative DNA-invertase from lambdoid prophage Rac